MIYVHILLIETNIEMRRVLKFSAHRGYCLQAPPHVMKAVGLLQYIVIIFNMSSGFPYDRSRPGLCGLSSGVFRGWDEIEECLTNPCSPWTGRPWSGDPIRFVRSNLEGWAAVAVAVVREPYHQCTDSVRFALRCTALFGSVFSIDVHHLSSLVQWSYSCSYSHFFTIFLPT